MADLGPYRVPDRQQDALSLVVAGPIGVGLAEVAQGDGTIDGPDDLGQGDLIWWSGQDVATTHAPFGANQACPFEGQQNLFQIGLRQPGAIRDIANRGWSVAVGMQSQGKQGPAGVVSSGRHLHWVQASEIAGPRWAYACLAVKAHQSDRAGIQVGERTKDDQGGRASALVLPAFGRGCVTDLMPVLLGRSPDTPLPVDLPAQGQRLLLVLDGVGWEQLQDRAALAPTMAAMTGGPITTVAPSTTATALTSITTGLAPAEHGIVGYRMRVDDQVLNCLRWGTEVTPDVRTIIPPAMLQPYPPFLGESLPLVTKEEFRRSGFSEAHLRGGRMVGYRTPAVLVHHAAQLLREGERMVYAYYDGVDKVAHEYGLSSVYDAELSFADRLVADMLAAVPTGTTVLVTADHGQVDCGRGLLQVDRDVMAHVASCSGEARFRWLHARAGRQVDVLEAAEACHASVAWVRSLDQIVDEGWFGSAMDREVRSRLGDVALLPFEPTGFDDPGDTGPFELIGRHGSVTAAEMLVPCLVATV